MSKLTQEITAVLQLPFVADAYQYRDAQTIIVVLKPEIRESMPLNRSTLTFQTDNFTVDAVIQAYEQEIVFFLSRTLRNAELLLAKSTRNKVTHLVPLCLN